MTLNGCYGCQFMSGAVTVCQSRQKECYASWVCVIGKGTEGDIG